MKASKEKPKFSGIWCGHDCPFLEPTEAEQDREFDESGVKRDHVCTKCSITVMHLDAHPKIYRCPDCMIEQVEAIGLDIIRALGGNGLQRIEATGKTYKSTILARGVRIEVNIR